MAVGFRERLYGSYLTSERQPQTGELLEALRRRGPYLRRLIRLHFPPAKDARILDLGCGYGALLHFAREQGYGNVRGVDTSRDQIEAAGRLGIDGADQGDVMATLIELEDSVLDCVTAFDLLEHLDREELFALADEVLRVLKPGGVWLIHVPNGESPFFGRNLYGDLTHEVAFTRTSIAQLMHAAGFSDVECFEDTPVPHGVKSWVRAVLWKMSRAMLRAYIAVETGDACRDAVFSQGLLATARA